MRKSSNNFYMHQFPRRVFSFYGNSISRVAGEKCCEYGQDGKPLSEAFVQSFLSNASAEVQFWRPNESFTLLTHSWFFLNYLQAAAFLLEIAKLDSMNVLKQQPNLQILRKEIVRVELTTPKLNGLSKADLALATQISLIPMKEFSVIPIMDERNFRKELRMKRGSEKK
jgi:pterin-4a-carbinolamine dehydratase